MVYPPRQETITTTARIVVNPDPNRDVVVVTNLTGATIYWGTDSSLSTANGAPIFNNGRAEFSRVNGRNPRIARWLITATGSGTISIDEESIGNGGIQ